MKDKLIESYNIQKPSGKRETLNIKDYFPEKTKIKKITSDIFYNDKYNKSIKLKPITLSHY